MRRRLIASALFALIAGGLALRQVERGPQALLAPAADVTRTLSAGDTAGFARATTPHRFVFPADHGPHPAYKQEWWYYTGNLHTAEGRRFGFQLTFFRIALAPHPTTSASSWTTNTVYMAHFALTDVAGDAFYASQRVERAALGLAGAQARPFRVWLDDWHASGAAMPTGFTASLHAATDAAAIDLRVSTADPPVLQGDHGLSQKSAQPGNASYYYSMPRLVTRGTLRLRDRSYRVDGLTWMDREWSTSALAPDQAGWDWFALQLSDGSDLMWYQLRLRDGRIDPHSAGILIRDRRGLALAPADVTLRVTDTWRSPHTHVRYPAAWTVDIPSLALHLAIRPEVSDQELHGLVQYWEGAVAARGTSAGARVTGSGYVELTGYPRTP